MSFRKIRTELLVSLAIVLFAFSFANAQMTSGSYAIQTDAMATEDVVSTSAVYTNRGVALSATPAGISSGDAQGRVTHNGFLYTTLPAIGDEDSDSLIALYDNCWYVNNVNQEDYDQDAWGDACDADDDNDQLSDVYELRYQLNPLDETDAADDSDGDGTSNLAEAQAGTDPTRVGSLLPGYILPEHVTPLLNAPEDGPVDGQRALP